MILNFSIEFVQIECCACSIKFYIPKRQDENNRRSTHLFYCPLGHGQSYTKSTEDLLRAELIEKNQRINVLTNENAEFFKIIEDNRKKRGKKKV